MEIAPKDIQVWSSSHKQGCMWQGLRRFQFNIKKVNDLNIFNRSNIVKWMSQEIATPSVFLLLVQGSQHSLKGPGKRVWALILLLSQMRKVSETEEWL